MQLILASTSRYRRELLERLGIPFAAYPPRVEEDALKDPALAPRALAEMLAEAKARSLQVAFPEAVILGSDQVCACERRILGKPGEAARAAEQLAFLAGRTHQLLTAVCLVHPGGCERHTDVTTLRMRPLTGEEIARYLAADEPFDCAGSYALERRGIALFESIDSADHSAITGLPLIAVAAMLRRLGFATP